MCTTLDGGGTFSLFLNTSIEPNSSLQKMTHKSTCLRVHHDSVSGLFIRGRAHVLLLRHIALFISTQVCW